MINSKQLLSDLQKRVRLLEDDLRARCNVQAEVDVPLRQDYEMARGKGRTSLTYNAWRDEELTQVAVAWVLAGVFIRFLEDNQLIEVPLLAGAEAARMKRAQDEHDLFFRQRPTANERDYFEQCFAQVGKLPGMTDFFDRRHNPLWRVGPTADAAKALLEFWRKSDPDTGRIIHDFKDPEWNTRFLGDLYQNLSEAAQKKFALLQTPVFVEEFILDRTLTPAIQTFGYKVVRMIDPTCGSGHFCLGGFERLFRLWQEDIPGENPRVLAQWALDGVYGVDLNPYAVAIARFRLLVAALKVCGIAKLKDAPDFKIHLAIGDSLLHGPEPGVVMDRNALKLRIEATVGAYQSEDANALAEILSQHYHAVVGNPPYVTVKDKKLNEVYRQIFSSCHRKYSLAVPFMERFFDLAMQGSPGQPLGAAPELALELPKAELLSGARQAGWVGMITANSFMKREFGKKLIEKFIPTWDLTHVIDTSGAYIPGHGTPTVILFGKRQRPVALTIRTVMGIKGEPATPEDPARGLVWSAMLDQVDRPGSESDYLSVVDTGREGFHHHPWSIGGGGAAELKETLDESAEKTLETIADTLGVMAVAGEDDVFISDDPGFWQRMRVDETFIKPLAMGDAIRDWVCGALPAALFPYDDRGSFIDCPSAAHHLWCFRSPLRSGIYFSKTKAQRGLDWRDYAVIVKDKFRTIPSIAYGEVASHNHFIFDRGGKAFNRTSPIIKLSPSANETDHLAITGILNSSIGCFWLKQVCFPKGGDHQGSEGARVRTTLWDERYAFNSTQVGGFPVTGEKPLVLTQELDRLAQTLQPHTPGTVLMDAADQRPLAVSAARQRWTEVLQRMIALQEELDWDCYRIYGLTEVKNQKSDGRSEYQADRATGDVPALNLGERAFEIVMARKMATREFNTTWFERHSSTPITKLPARWPKVYQQLVERRIALIESDRNIGLLEQPEYKRRWNVEPWDQQLERAAREWLLNRLEAYFFEGERMLAKRRTHSEEIRSEDNTAPPDPLANVRCNWVAGQQPALVSTSQLGAVVEGDHTFLEVAEIYSGSPGFSVAKLVRELVESESVPFLPFQRYKESGLRKRRDWEQVWDLQREEDRISAQKKALEQGIHDRIRSRLEKEHAAELAAERAQKTSLAILDEAYHNRFRPGKKYNPEHAHFSETSYPSDPVELAEYSKVLDAYRLYQSLKQALEVAESKIRSSDEVVRGLETEISQLPPIPTIAVPPKYASADFKSSIHWRLRGKLDVPKERWVSYPGAEREGDDSPVIAWAGWDHLQKAKALAEYYVDASQNRGWPPEKLQPLLAGLVELLPWVKQWHNDFDAEAGMGFGDYLAGFLEDEARKQGVTIGALNRLSFGEGRTQATSPTRRPVRREEFTPPSSPEIAAFAQAYPSTAADRLVCSLALELVAWRDPIDSNDQLDAMILATHTDIRRVFANATNSSSLDTWSRKAKAEISVVTAEGLKWVQCLRYLEQHRKALEIARTQLGRSTRAGEGFDEARKEFAFSNAGVAPSVLAILDEMKAVRERLDLSAEQSTALGSLQELHTRNALAMEEA